jgi:hypothetical protein
MVERLGIDPSEAINGNFCILFSIGSKYNYIDFSNT